MFTFAKWPFYSRWLRRNGWIIIELKYAEDGNLEAACAKALAQIEEKKYAEGLRRRRMKTILKYGIAFWEKECQVVLG